MITTDDVDPVPGVWRPTEVAGAFLKEINAAIHPGMKVLDLGCGSGILGLACAERGAIVSASDMNARACQSTAEEFLRRGMKADVRCGDGLKPWKGEDFDAIICNPPNFNYVWDGSGFKLNPPCRYFPLPILTYIILSQGKAFLKQDGFVLTSFGKWIFPDISLLIERLFFWKIVFCHTHTAEVDHSIFENCKEDLIEKGVLTAIEGRPYFPTAIVG